MLSEPQTPPAPKVINVPPPLRLPVPVGQVSVVLPATAVPAVEPKLTLSVVLPPSDTAPPPVRPVPAVMVRPLFTKLLLAMVPLAILLPVTVPAAILAPVTVPAAIVLMPALSTVMSPESAALTQFVPLYIRMSPPVKLLTDNAVPAKPVT